MIPFNDLGREYASLKNELDAALSGVMKRGYFILGPEVERFEKDFAAYNGTPFGVGVNSGTDALYLSLLAAGIGKGDEVIVPVNTALPTAMAVVMAGARPLFVDCDESFLIDIHAVAGAITKKTKAVIPVHLYGQACDMERIRDIAHAHKLVVIEDCAQAAGAEWKGKKVGSFGDLGAYSFYPTKALGAYGDGGMVLTNNEEYYKRVRAQRFYGEPDKVRSVMFGVNSRLDEMQAAILNVKLKRLDEWNAKRRELAALYAKLLKNVELPLIAGGPEHVYHLFVVRSSERDALREKLKAAGIDTLIHYPLLLHQHPFFKEFARLSFPCAEKLNKEILSLPLHPYLTSEEIRTVAHVVNSFRA